MAVRVVEQGLPTPNPGLAGGWAAGADAWAMRKLVTLTMTVLLLGLFAAVVYAAVDAGDDSPVATTETSPTTGTTETTTTNDDGTPDQGRGDRDRDDRRADDAPAGVDISGPCDEAEHAGDPRCGGVVGGTTTTPAPGVDISGPCDEAEHAGDPRCTGVTPRVEDNNRQDRHGDDDRFDDHGGDVDNSGPGSDNSGPGSFDDGDHSGSGHGGGDDHGGNSGHGGGDDD